MKIMLISTFLIFSCYTAYAQQRAEYYNNEPFALQVKQLDEFIERFNNNDDALVKEYLGKKYGVELRREELILSLFDHSDFSSEEKNRAIKFVEEVVGKQDPPFLNFYDDAWYAKLDCQAKYKNETFTFNLIMKVKLGNDKRSVNWAIRSINSQKINRRGAFEFKTLLPPSSHGTNFQELNRIFRNPEKYVDATQTDQNPMNMLLHLAASGELKFLGVSHVSYHFLQLNGWIMKVEEFNRRTNNSGWLISELYPANAQTKNNYLSNHLFIHQR